MLDYLEPTTSLDPLTILLMREDEEGLDPEIEILESERSAGLHRTAPKSSASAYEYTQTRTRF
jgi:hypothetical protein